MKTTCLNFRRSLAVAADLAKTAYYLRPTIEWIWNALF